MEQITTVGIDLAKNVFQVHAIDAAGEVIVSKAVLRAGLLQLLSRFPVALGRYCRIRPLAFSLLPRCQGL